MTGVLTRRYFGVPVWVLALVGAIVIYYLYSRGGSAKGGADPNAEDETGNPLSYPATFNVSVKRRKKKKKAKK